jgi:hypothetical protein
MARKSLFDRRARAKLDRQLLAADSTDIGRRRPFSYLAGCSG